MPRVCLHQRGDHGWGAFEPLGSGTAVVTSVRIGFGEAVGDSRTGAEMIRRFAARSCVLGLFLAAIVAGCAGDGDGSARRPPASAGGSPPAVGAPLGPGVGVADALGLGIDGPVLVNGYIVATTTGVRLCTTLGESTPPECAGPEIEVRGLPDGGLERLVTARRGGTRWSAASVQVLGVVRNGRLVVEPGTTG